MENQVVVSEEEQKRNNDMNGRVRHSSSSNNSNYSWDFWELGTSWNNHNHNNNSLIFSDQVNNGQPNPHHFHHHHHHQNHHQNHHHTLHPSHTSLYGGERSNLHPDPHLTCLKLGKRHYFEDVNGGPVLLGERHVDGFQMGKRGRSYESFVGLGGGGVVVGGSSSSSPSSTSSIGVGVAGVGMIGSSAMVIPRCQVEGCHVVLVNAKDYHRRHKVCEMHSKAPKVTVLGLEQRFCQQCSRFHMISEFDDAKRSCRRRLAGHNERRRKSSSDSITRNPSQESRLTDDSFSFLTPPTGRALSLLSSKSTSCVSQADISSRSSAALRELIAENRAAVLARQLLLNQNWHQHGIGQATHDDSQVELLTQVPVLQHQFPESSEWDRFQESNAHVTLDLMQTPSSPFGFIPGRSKSKEEEEECCELWKSLEGTNVV